MMAMERASTAALASLLADDDIRIRTGLSAADLHEACLQSDLAGAVYNRLRRAPHNDRLRELQERLAPDVRAAAILELVRQRETRRVLDALAATGIHPVLFKGTALAYGVYETPEARPRDDTDLLIPRHQVETARAALARLGYQPHLFCDGELVFCQFALYRRETNGVVHTLDIHWKISTQSVFADLLTFDELVAAAVPIAALGPHARGPSAVHAMLLACVHPVMHHRGEERLIWIHDIHLLAARLDAPDFDGLVALAADKQVAAIVRHGLSLAQRHFGSPVPAAALRRLELAGQEPSAAYLRPSRRWRDELLSNLINLPDWRQRLQLLREVLFPRPVYMLRSYGIAGGTASATLLPLLYVHRCARGMWNVLTGRK